MSPALTAANASANVKYATSLTFAANTFFPSLVKEVYCPVTAYKDTAYMAELAAQREEVAYDEKQ